AGEFPEQQPLHRELDGNSVEHNLYSVMVYAEKNFNDELFRQAVCRYAQAFYIRYFFSVQKFTVLFMWKNYF
ncbi:hypothetical protein, partial [Enterobacter hormaechei]